MALAVSWSGGGCCDSHRVTSTYRYKRPPRKRKAVALEVPAVVTVAREKLGRVARARQPVTVAADPEAAPRLAIVTTASMTNSISGRGSIFIKARNCSHPNLFVECHFGRSLRTGIFLILVRV